MVQEKLRLKDKVAIITGSTSGIGEETAKLFADEGASVVIVGRRQDRGEKVVETIRQNGGNAIFVKTDVTKNEDLKNMVDKTLANFKQVDILVNNAGRIIQKPFTEITEDDWEQYVRLNSYSYFRAMQIVLPHMESKGSGSIVNVTSAAAINVRKTHALYSFTKAGITHMSKIVAAEYADKGIRVNCLLPGVVYTEMIADNPRTPEVAKGIPLGRMSTPEEQAKSVLYLASEDSSFMTGSSIVTDGGVTGI
ncbi:SDR family NAD(P)-dependent oxidoreductase [Psychrobacillus sp. BM2]|uniref:SDR family NAD(P)-dependent oxidoreductase n=1 Tax=Psychrobacillus sp. BM2 TaxID=3400421 RepID=UPI003B01AF9A